MLEEGSKFPNNIKWFKGAFSGFLFSVSGLTVREGEEITGLILKGVTSRGLSRPDTVQDTYL